VARIIAIANQKGGVGKTTTSINVAASLAALGKRTLLVDVDPQGNSTTGIGIDRAQLVASLYDVLAGRSLLGDVLLQTQIPQLLVIPSSKDLVGAEVELVTAERREYRLKDAVEPLRDLYDYVLLDCGPSLGLLTLNALTAADSLLVPIQSEYYALEGLSALLETVRLVQQRLNPNLRLEGIVVTMFDSRNRLSHQVFEEIRAHFPTKLYRTVVRRNVRLSEAPSYGKPICLYDPTSSGAQDYMALAKELSGEGVENVGTDEGVG
jgi:chromosome partitioning protein